MGENFPLTGNHLLSNSQSTTISNCLSSRNLLKLLLVLTWFPWVLNINRNHILHQIVFIWIRVHFITESDNLMVLCEDLLKITDLSGQSWV